MQSIRASIDIRASLTDALRRWSEFAAPDPGGCLVQFEALAPMASRLTLELAEPVADGRVRRRLLAFKVFAEQAGPADPCHAGA